MKQIPKIFFMHFNSIIRDLVDLQVQILVVLTGKIPYFVSSENIISLIELCKKLQLRSVRRLASVQFLTALHIYLVGSAKDLKDVMSKFFHNLFLQSLSTFEAMNKIYQIIASNLSILKLEFMKDKIERSFEDDKKLQDTIVTMESSASTVTETDMVETILKDEKSTFPDDKSHLKK